jgi:hypothetical protein
VSFVVPQHPELVDLAHYEACHFSEPLVLVLQSGLLVGLVKDWGVKDEMLISSEPCVAPVAWKYRHTADGSLGFHDDCKFVVLGDYPAIEEALEHGFEERNEIGSSDEVLCPRR